MHTTKPDADARLRDLILASIPSAYAPQGRYRRLSRALTISIGDVDLPGFVSDGQLYIQAPLPCVFRAFAEDISDFISDLEIRVSAQGCRSLPPAHNGSAAHRARVAKSRVVRSGGIK